MGGNAQSGLVKAITDASEGYMKFQQRGGMLGAAANYSPDTKRILGPILNAVQSPMQTAGKAMEYVGPQADVNDMKNYSRDTWNSAKAGRYPDALANLGMTAAAVGMAALPGSVSSVDDILKGATKKADDVGIDAYHGTSKDIRGQLTPSKGGEFGPGTYLTTSANEAGSYTGTHDSGLGANVMPVRAALENPLRIKSPEEFWQRFGGEGISDEAAVESAKAAGFDGIVFNRPVQYWDDATNKVASTGEMQDHIVVFPGHESKIQSRFADSLPLDEASRMARVNTTGLPPPKLLGNSKTTPKILEGDGFPDPNTHSGRMAIQGGPKAAKPGLERIGRVLDDHGIKWEWNNEVGGITAIEEFSSGPSKRKHFDEKTSLKTLRNWLGY
jgi:hypothetical protein